MQIETKRLSIRPLQWQDCGALHEILSDPEVMRFVEPPFDREQTRRFIETAGLCAPPLVYAVVEKQTGRLIGHLIWFFTKS